METPKEDKNGNTSGVQITFWVFFAVLVAIIIVCVALLIYVAVLFNTYKTAFVGAVFQSSACEVYDLIQSSFLEKLTISSTAESMSVDKCASGRSHYLPRQL